MPQPNELKLFLNDIQEHGHYQSFLDVISESRPHVPPYDFVKENESEMRFKSAQQQGFDLFAALLNIQFKD
jgi:hypothetical protein